MCLVAVEAQSKWLEVVEMPTTTASQTVTVLMRMFSANGLPEQLVTDNGPQFVSEEFASFCRSNGIKHICVSPYHPSSNGLAERLVQTFKVASRKLEKNELFLLHHLVSFLLIYHTTPQRTTSVPPVVLFMGRPLRTRLDLFCPDLGCTVTSQQSVQKQHHDNHSKPCSMQAGCTVTSQLSVQKQHHDNHSKPHSMQVGQSVMAWDFRGSSQWVPASVVTQFGLVSFMVNTSTGLLWKQHIDHIHACGEGRTLYWRLNQLNRKSFAVLSVNNH